VTARRIAAIALFCVTAGLAWIALLTPLRSNEIAELDAEAQRLGEEWNEVSTSGGSGNLLGGDDERARELQESNQAYAAARDLEPPLDPLQALGGALLAASGGIALWPGRSDRSDGGATAAPAEEAAARQ
jgi:hypothetical protein